MVELKGHDDEWLTTELAESQEADALHVPVSGYIAREAIEVLCINQ